MEPETPKKVRLFFALRIPEDLKGRLEYWQKKFLDLPVHWTKAKDLHVTVLFLGWVDATRLPDVAEGAKTVAGSFPDFSIRFTGIDYGPPHAARRMVWLYGAASLELTKLKRSVALEMHRREIPSVSETQELVPHITLGRIRTEEWRKKIKKEAPTIAEPCDRTVHFETLDLMQSTLSRNGATYTIVQSYPFTGESSIA